MHVRVTNYIEIFQLNSVAQSCPTLCNSMSHSAGVQPQQDPGEPSGWTASANERETVRQSSGLSPEFIFARPLYTLNNIFGGSAYCLHTGHLKTLQQLDFNRNRMSPTYFSFTRVFLMIWPLGLLTLYGLHLVWLKQLQ